MIKLFWKLTTTRFLLQELHDHNTLLCDHILNDKETKHVKHLLNTYILPEIERRGL